MRVLRQLHTADQIINVWFERMDKRAFALLSVIAAAVLFSTGGTAIKACTFSGWQVASFRSGLAAVALLVMLPAARRGWSWRSALVGLTYAATMVLFVTANKLTTAANTIFLQSAAPLYVLALSPWLLKETIRGRDLAFMGLVVLGLAMFFVGAEPPRETAPEPLLGNVLAAIAGVTWALTIMGLRWLGKDRRQRDATVPALVIGNLIAFVACLPLALPVSSGTARDWLVIGFLGVFQIGLAYVLLTHGIAHVTALEASTLLLIEPVMNPIWAYAFQGEIPGQWAICGGVLIVGSTVLKALWDARGETR